ncbi:DUF4405 domain-containing protein [Candidatus Woesearchaeota archaeon]|nr:DUF4405 domain-containing protein [Candidatus Woesearchaeota archaeon]
MAVSFIITAATGLAIFFFLPSQVRGGRLYEFLGITKGTWKIIHDWAGIIMVLLVIIHLALHWKWIVNMTKNLFSKKKIEKK